MSSEARMYKILGSDGSEYGPVSVDKIKQWIQENRVEQKTPVLPEGGEDWVFLGSLPEFKESFAALEKGEAKDTTKSRRWWQLAISLGLLLAALFVSALFILGKIKHH
jgi:hypothetical protein